MTEEIATRRDLTEALDALIRGDGVHRGRHRLVYEGLDVSADFIGRLKANGFRPMTVKEAPIEAGERIPAFRVRNGATDFGWIRWEIFTPRSRRKLFHSEYRNPANNEWDVQINLGSPERVWANPDLKERHDVETVVAVNP